MKNCTKTGSSEMMIESGSDFSLVESFLDEYYLFRRNILSGKTEYLIIKKDDESELEEKDGDWKVLTNNAFNSIVRHAKRLGIGENKSPRQDIDEFINSEEVPVYNPIKEYLESLPKWDGQNQVAELFGRIPGLTSEQLNWCSIWLRSAVAHWLQMDMLHGNEAERVPLPFACCRRNFANISSTTSTLAISLIPRWHSPTISLSISTSSPTWELRSRASSSKPSPR